MFASNRKSSSFKQRLKALKKEEDAIKNQMRSLNKIINLSQNSPQNPKAIEYAIERSTTRTSNNINKGRAEARPSTDNNNNNNNNNSNNVVVDQKFAAYITTGSFIPTDFRDRSFPIRRNRILFLLFFILLGIIIVYRLLSFLFS